jgi:hypothetical protein
MTSGAMVFRPASRLRDEPEHHEYRNVLGIRTGCRGLGVHERTSHWARGQFGQTTAQNPSQFSFLPNC